jgi:hypothetical protein
MINLFITTFYGYALALELLAQGCRFTVNVKIKDEKYLMNQYLSTQIDTDRVPEDSLVLKEGKEVVFTNFKEGVTYYSGDFKRDIEHLREVLYCL